MKENQILLLHGTQYKMMAMELMEKAGLAADIGDPAKKIGLKPNLVVAAAAENGATTHPELVAGVIEYLQRHGFQNLCVLEGAWVGETTCAAYRATGLDAVCKAYGVPFYDLQKDTATRCDAQGMQIRVCDRALALDYLINMPVMKGHCQTKVTCALKNAKGLIPNAEKRRFHTLGLHKPIAHLNTVVPRGMVVVDNLCGDLDFEEGGNPVEMNRIFCCKDPVLCDAFVCESMGCRVEDVPYIRLAEQLGIGSADTAAAEIVPLNDGAGITPQKLTGRIRPLAACAAPCDACSACYGSLIYALEQLRKAGQLDGHREKIAIGQGHKGKSGAIGVGTCTGGFACSLKGCPPKAADMVRFLQENWK